MTQRSILANATFLTGVGLLIYSCWLIWPPLVFAAAGAALISMSVYVTRPQIASPKQRGET